jgi:hypothetical protein
MKLEDVQKLQGDQVAGVPGIPGCVDGDNFRSASWIRYARICRSLERFQRLGRHLSSQYIQASIFTKNSRYQSQDRI